MLKYRMFRTKAIAAYWRQYSICNHENGGL